MRRKKTQKEIVLEMLEVGGSEGVHSFEFIQARVPRVAARIHELRAEGYQIESEHAVFNGTAEGVRYMLVGVGAGEVKRPSREARGVRENPELSADSGKSAAGAPILSPPAAPPTLPGFEETAYERLQDKAA
jgi:helix-turn-helix protein